MNNKRDMDNKRDTKRSKLLISNVAASFVVKGWSAFIVLWMVPLTLTCLGSYKNGVWLTISSILVWIDQMDIGLGNGLRNKLAIHMAHQQYEEARQIVSSTLAMLICIVVPLLLILWALIAYGDVYGMLNVDPELIPELRTALTAAVTLVCMTFVLKFIGNVYMGMQLPAVSNLLLALGQTVALILTALLYYTDQASFTAIVIANTAAPLLVYLIAYPYTFFKQFPMLRPSLKWVKMGAAMELGNLGVKFFWLQVAALIQFATANILISRFFTPEMVTPYQIAYRYVSIVMIAFTVICMPFWNATTDAYERGDMDWIRRSSRRMNWMTMMILGLLVVMVIISPWVYDIWIGDRCEVPMGMTAMMALYIFLMVLSLRYSYFLNGVGALRLQLYMTVMTVVFIPLAWLVSRETHNILCFMGVMCFCIAPSIVVNMLQFNKILKGRATGWWRIK